MPEGEVPRSWNVGSREATQGGRAAIGEKTHGVSVKSR